MPIKWHIIIIICTSVFVNETITVINTIRTEDNMAQLRILYIYNIIYNTFYR